MINYHIISYLLLYIGGCVRNFTGSTGTIVSENYPGYPADTDCLYVIKNTGNDVLKLKFNDLDLAGDGDFIEVRLLFNKSYLHFYAVWVYIRQI